MSPRPGIFSTNTWTLIAIYLRNLLLNWTVFLPLIAMFLLLPRLYLALADSRLLGNALEKSEHYYLWIFGSLGLLGIIAVFNIIVMRPSLSLLSWSDQHYKIDNIGTVVSAESKVRTWCLVPILVVAFGITACWIWTGELENYQFTTGFFPEGFFVANETRKLIVFILFYELLFLGGFMLAHPLLQLGIIKKIKEWFSSVKKKIKGRFGIAVKEIKAETANAARKGVGKSDVHFLREFCVSAVSGALGGAVLYLFANLLERAKPGIQAAPKIYESSPEIAINTFYVCFAPPLFLIKVLLSTAFFVGVAGKIYEDIDREWLSRFGAWILIVIIGWSVLSSVVLFGPELFKLERVR